MNQGTLLQRRKRAVRFSKEEALLMLRSYRQHPTCWKDVINEVKLNLDRLPEPASELYRTANNKRLQDRHSSKFGKLIGTRLDQIQDLDIRNAVELVLQNERRLVQPAQAHVPVAPGPAVPGPAVPAPAAPGPAVPVFAAPGPTVPVPAAPGPAVSVRAAPGPTVPVHAAPGPAVPMPAVPVPAVPGPAIPVPAAQVPPGPINRRDAAAAALSDQEEDDNAIAQRRPKRPLIDLMRENHQMYNDFMKKKLPKILRELGVSSDSD